MYKTALILALAIATVLCHNHGSPLSQISVNNIQSRLDDQVAINVGVRKF
jgi:hypothetical protein